MFFDLRGLRRLGIDEISLRKGQGDYIVVLVDLDSHKLLGLVKERKQVELEKVLKGWGEDILLQIEEVSMYLCKIYKSLVNKLCPNAVVTADRFHVMKLVNEELNQARIDKKNSSKFRNRKKS